MIGPSLDTMTWGAPRLRHHSLLSSSSNQSSIFSEPLTYWSAQATKNSVGARLEITKKHAITVGTWSCASSCRASPASALRATVTMLLSGKSSNPTRVFRTVLNHSRHSHLVAKNSWTGYLCVSYGHCEWFWMAACAISCNYMQLLNELPMCTQV